MKPTDELVEAVRHDLLRLNRATCEGEAVALLCALARSQSELILDLQRQLCDATRPAAPTGQAPRPLGY